MLIFQGIVLAFLSLTTPDGSGTPGFAFPGGSLRLSSILVIVFSAAFAIQNLWPISRRKTILVVLGLAVLLAMGAWFTSQGGIAPHKGTARTEGTHYVFMFVLLGYAATMVAVASLALHWKHAPEKSNGLPLLAAGLALVPLATLSSAAVYSPGEGLLAAFAVACILPWLPLARSGVGSIGRNVALGLLFWAVLWETYVPFWRPLLSLQGALGVIQVVAALAMARSLLQARVFGIDPPAFAQRRGTLTAVALAALFVVAQVAQNFLQAEYGLLLGGLIAGIVLFAVNPLQKAIERRSQPANRLSRAEAESSYRKAVNLALRDRSVTREEEGHLHELARDLGIDGARAHAIIVDAERNRGTNRRDRRQHA